MVAQPLSESSKYTLTLLISLCLTGTDYFLWLIVPFSETDWEIELISYLIYLKLKIHEKACCNAIFNQLGVWQIIVTIFLKLSVLFIIILLLFRGSVFEGVNKGKWTT